MPNTPTTPDSTPAPPIELRATGSLRPHPQAGEIPKPSEEEYRALRADVGERSLQTPLEVTLDGLVLDGHQRLKAAHELGLEQLPVRVVAPPDQLEYMLRQALLRRQLTASQRAAVAARLVEVSDLRAAGKERSLANLRRGGEVATLPARGEAATLPARGERTRELVAQLAGTSARTVQDVLTVQEHEPELLDRVLRGELSASTAASKVRRAQRDAALPAARPLPEGPFELILADPPWSFGSPDSEFAPEQHYPCMTTADIKAITVPAAENCILFLWAVTCLLPEAIQVMQAWGFAYKSSMVWVKTGIGPGVWLRHRHELLLLGIRGQISPPDPEERVDSVIEAARGRHSEKPELAYQRIEAMYPQLTKLELFARDSRPGWTSWGNEAPTGTGVESA